MISFLVTYYNQVQYVNKSLDSILRQKTSSDFEILICDDGSDDGTLDIIKDYVLKYSSIIRYFVMPREKNKKYSSVERVSASRIKLLSEAKGEYFCFLDGDDYYCNYDFVDLAIIKFNTDKKCGISVISFNHIYEDGGKKKSIKSRNKIKEGIVDKREYICNKYIHAGACIFRKVYANYTEEISKLWQYDDNNIVLYALRFGDMYHYDIDIYTYVQHDDSNYKRMSIIEKSLLNCLGLDTDLILLPMYNEELFIRNEFSLVILYYNYKRIVDSIPSDKLEIYVRLANNYNASLTNAFLLQEENSVNNIIHTVFNQSKRRFLMAIIKMQIVKTLDRGMQ